MHFSQFRQLPTVQSILYGPVNQSSPFPLFWNGDLSSLLSEIRATADHDQQGASSRGTNSRGRLPSHEHLYEFN